jgi:2,5-diketo-D-gluconate reductase A
MTLTTPTLELNNGVTMPALGLGVFQSPPTETVTAVETALADGYRLIDTAAAYGNEREVGDGIRRSGIDRDEIFVATKLWISDYGYDNALVGFEAGLRRLGVDHVDLYLLHQPVPTDFEATIGAYKAAEAMLAEGRARAIGVSNFSAEHLRRLIDRTDVVPAANQVEVHPYFTQAALRAAHAELGIVTQCWSPLGGVLVYVPGSDESRGPLTDPVITELAASTARLRRRSSCVGTSSTASARSRNRSSRTALRRTSMSSTSRCPPRRSRRSTRWIRACAAAPTPRRSTARRTRRSSTTLNDMSMMLGRRSFLRLAIAGVAGAAASACGAGSPSAPRPDAPRAPGTARGARGKILLVCFSRPGENYHYGGRRNLEVGNTEVLAGAISARLACDVHRIEPVDRYPADYEETVDRNVREQDSDARPAIANPLPSIDQYDTVLLGSPIWNVRAPMIMLTFADRYDFSGKTVLPFTTYAMSGLGAVPDDYQRACEGARIGQGLAVRGEEVRGAGATVDAWLRRTSLRI